MPNNTVVKVKVEKLTKFGYADEQGYVSYSKNLTDHDKALVVPGAEFEAELYTAESGARYLNKIVARASHVEAPKAQTVKNTVSTPKTNPKHFQIAKDASDTAMTRADWDNKDRRISRQGCIQAAVQALTGVYPTVQDLYDAADELATKMLEFVNR